MLEANIQHTESIKWKFDVSFEEANILSPDVKFVVYVKIICKLKEYGIFK